MKNEVFHPDVMDYDDGDAQRTVAPPEHDFEAAGSTMIVDEAKFVSENSTLQRKIAPDFSGCYQASVFL